MIKHLFKIKKKLPTALEWEANEINDSGAKLTESPTVTHNQFLLFRRIFKGSQRGVNSYKGNLNSVTKPMMKHENPSLIFKRSKRQPSKSNEDFLW
jgi:hypothetical protein